MIVLLLGRFGSLTSIKSHSKNCNKIRYYNAHLSLKLMKDVF